MVPSALGMHMETQLVQLLPDRATFGALILKRQVSQGSSGELWSKRVVLLSECDEVFGVWWGDEVVDLEN